jgi:hypothetical protein
MGFTEVFQELYVMRRGRIIYFFYVDDIVFAFKKKDTQYVTDIVLEIRNQFKLNKIGELKWFLRIYIFKNRLKKSFWLSQQTYIEKLANKFTAGVQSDK